MKPPRFKYQIGVGTKVKPVVAPSAAAVFDNFKAKIVNSCPGWAFGYMPDGKTTLTVVW